VKKTLYILSAVLGSLTTYAQTEALMKQYKDEHAVITGNSEHVKYYFQKGELKATTSVTIETLMLTDKAPAMYNTHTVHHGSFTRLENLEASTLIPKGDNDYKKIKANEFKTTKATARGIFYDDGEQTQVTFTGLVKGGKSLVSYELIHDDIHFIPTCYFQTYLPSAVTEYKVTVPKSVRLKWQLHGLDTDKLLFTTEETRSEITYTWKGADIAKYISYDFSPGASYYLPHLITYVESYTKPRSDEDVRVFGTTADLYRFYYSFVRNLNTVASPELGKLVATVTAGAKTDEEKAAKIYQYVQQNIKYVAFEDGMGGFIPREASLVCNRKYGDCKDMSSLLVAMCRAADLKAFYTWIGTRDRPYSYLKSPFPIADNHMICVVEIDGKWIVLDGTDAQIPFGIPPANIQGKEALVGISKDEYKVITIPTASAEENVMTDSTFVKLTAKDISGATNIRVSGYGAWRINTRMLYYNAREKEDLVKSFMSRGSNKYLQKSFDYKASEDSKKDAIFSANFELKDYSQQVGKEVFVNMNLLRPFENYYVDVKDRNVPIEFDYNNIVKQVVVMDIPEGYRVSYLPPSSQQNLDSLWGYKISYTASAKQITLVKEYQVNTLYLDSKKFADHNKVVSALKKQHKESVVLIAE